MMTPETHISCNPELLLYFLHWQSKGVKISNKLEVRLVLDEPNRADSITIMHGRWIDTTELLLIYEEVREYDMSCFSQVTACEWWQSEEGTGIFLRFE